MLLLASGRSVSTDQLCDAVWGDHQPASSAKVLQNVVLRLRRVLGTATIVTGSGGYAVDMTSATTDAACFEHLVAEGRAHADERQWKAAAASFTAAAALWRGSPFVELAEWPTARAEATRLEELMRGATEDLAEMQLAAGLHHDWIGELELMAVAEPLREKRWELLALALYRDGRQADAMRTFRRARGHLTDIGLDPGPSMRDLERAISVHDPTIAAAREPTRHEPLELQPELHAQEGLPFAGRSAEMLHMEAVWQGVAAGRRRTIVIGGDAGVGKSRLAVEFSSACHARGATVFVGRCDPDVSLAYQPWIGVIEQAANSATASERADLASVFSDLSIAVPTLESTAAAIPRLSSRNPAAERQRLFTALDELLVTFAARGPLVVLIEDIHWAGAQTLALLRHVAWIQDTSRLLLIATYRDAIDEVTEPLGSLLGELRRWDHVEQIGLRGVDQRAVASIVAEVAGAELDGSPRSLAAFIHARTDGNAFYTCELIRHLLAAGVDLDGDWRTRVASDLTVPDSIRDVVAARVARLSAGARAVLDVAAIAGTRSEMRVLSGATPPDHDIASAIDELVASGLVVPVDAPWLSIQFAHAIVRDTVERAILPVLRAVTHLRLGEVIETIHEADRRPVLAELARHYLAAATLGDSGKAVYYSRRAAAHAVGSFAYDEAIRLLFPALELTLTRPADRLDVVMDLGVAQHRHGRHTEARAAYAEVFELARTLDRADTAALAAIEFEHCTQMPALPGGDAAAMLQQALDLLPAEAAALRLRTASALASALALAGRREEAAARLDNVFEAARRSDDAASHASALTAALRVEDDPQQMLAWCDELETLARQVDDPWSLVVAATWKFPTLMVLGRIDDARVTLHVLQQAIERGSYAFHQYVALVEGAVLAIADADFARAEENAEAARELDAEEDGEVGEGVFGLQMFIIRREQARLAEVLPVAQLVASRPTNDAGVWAPGVAALYAELGMTDDLRAHLDRIGSGGFACVPRDSLWPVCATFLADACIAAGSVPLAQLILGELRAHEGHHLMAGMTVCVGPADRYLGRLAAFLGERDDAARHFERALSMAERSGSPLWQAQVLADWGAFTQPSNARLGRQRASRALTLAERHGMAAVEARCRAVLGG